MGTDLTRQRCRPQSGAPLGDDEVRRHLREVPQWTQTDGAIDRTFRFTNYHETLAFVNAVAWIAHREDHHPDLSVGYDRCTVRFNTHSVGGLSINDFICAAKVDALVPPRA